MTPAPEARLRLLADCAQHLISTEDPEAIARGIFERVRDHLALDAYLNFLFDPSSHCLRLGSCAGLPPEDVSRLGRLEMGQAVCGTVAQLRRPIVASQVQQSSDPKTDLIRSLGIRVYNCNPLMAGQRLLGTLSFASRRRDQFEPDELAFMQTLCHYVEMALERSRLSLETKQAMKSLEERSTALHQSEQRVAEQFSNAPVAIVEYGPDFRITRWNPAAERIFGWTAAEVVGRSYNEFRWIYEADAPCVDGVARNLMDRSTRSVMNANRNYHKDGRVLEMEWYNSASFRPDGAFSGLLCFGIDVTARNRVREELRGALQVQQLHNQNSPVAIVGWDHEYRITQWTGQAQAIFGRAPAEMLGRKLSESNLVVPEDLPQVAALSQAMADGRSPTNVNVNRNVRKDGSIIVCEWYNSAIYDAGGRLKSVWSLVLDVTLRHAAETTLRESEAHFRQVAESLPLLVGAARPDGGFDYISSQWARYTGRSELEQLRDGWLQSVHDEDRPAVIARWRACLKSGELFEAEFRLRRADGVFRWFKGRARAIRNQDGQIIRWFGSCTDIEDQKRSEDRLAEAVRQRTEELLKKEEELAQARRLEAVGRLAGGVAHDFNNVLTGILGLAEDLRSTLPAGDARADDLNEIVRAASRAFGISKQLLAVGGRQVVRPAILDINEALGETTRMLKRLIGEDIALVTDFRSHGRIKIDGGQLEQAVINLVINARDAMPHGGTLTLTTSNVERPGEGGAVPFIELRVEDTGSGMTEEIRRQIFEPFFTTKSDARGSGLGLPTVYGIVKQHGGDVEVESRPGAGSVFRLFFPVTNEAPIPTKPDGSNGSARSPGGEILLVEDEPIVRRVIGRKLQSAGYRVTEAQDVQEALQKAEGRTFDLVITDVIMPGINGRRLVEKLREKDPGLPALFVSGYPADVIAQRGILEPGFEFLEKTVLNEKLLARVEQLLRRPVGSEP